MLSHDAWHSAEYNLDAALHIDAAPGTINVAHSHGNTLDRARVSSELVSQASADILAVVVVELDAVETDIRRDCRLRVATARAFHGAGDLVHDRFSLIDHGAVMIAKRSRLCARELAQEFLHVALDEIRVRNEDEVSRARNAYHL